MPHGVRRMPTRIHPPESPASRGIDGGIGIDAADALMMSVLMALCSALRTSVTSHIELQLEVLALRQQIDVLERSWRARVRLSRADRAFWCGFRACGPDGDVH